MAKRIFDPAMMNVAQSRSSGSTNVAPLQFKNTSVDSIRYVPQEAPGSAAINFNNNRISSAMTDLAKLQSSLNKTLFNEAIIQATGNTNKASEDWIQNNPTGEGYSQFVTEYWQHQITDLAKKSPNQEVQEMIKLHGSAAMPDMISSSLHQEKQLRIKYLDGSIEQNKQAILSQLITNPSLESPLKLQYQQQIEAMGEVLPPADFQKYKTNAMDEFGKTYGMALIQQDPFGARSLLQKGKIEGLDAGTRLALIEHANHAVHAAEILNRQNAAIEKNMQMANGAIKTATLLAQAATGRANSASTDSSEVSDPNRKMLRNVMSSMDALKTSDLQKIHGVYDAMAHNRPLYGLSHDEVNRAYDFMISNNSGKEFTLVEKAQIAVAMKADTRIDNLTADIANTLQYSNDPSQVINGCQAFRLLQDTNRQLLGGDSVDSKLEYFTTAILSQTLHEGANTHNLKDTIERNRRIFFEPMTKEVEEIRRHTFRQFVANSNINDIVTDLEDSHFWNNNVDIDSSTKITLTTDAYRVAEIAIMNGADEKTAGKIAQNWLSRNYGHTSLNDRKYKQLMKYAPELVYPGHSKNVFRNEMAYEIQKIVKANMKAMGNDTEVKLEAPLYDNPSGKKYFDDINYSRNNMTILAKLGNEYKKVRVKIESDPMHKGLYFLYYEYDIDGLKGKKYLRNPGDILRTPFRFQFPKSGEEVISGD
jgi:hypothetical protein